MGNRSRFLSVLRLVGIVAVVGVVSSVSIAAIAFNGLATTVQANTVELGNEAAVQQLVDVGAAEGDVNVLIVGSDTRVDQLATEGDDTDGARNDVTMLLHVSKDHQNVSVISFPRDTMVDMAECTDPDTGEVFEETSYQQLNTALGRGGQRGGLGCVVATVEQITGLTIPYAGVISFDGVAAMTSAIGGVDVCVSEAINDPTRIFTSTRAPIRSPETRRWRSCARERVSATAATSHASARSRCICPHSFARCSPTAPSITSSLSTASPMPPSTTCSSPRSWARSTQWSPSPGRSRAYNSTRSPSCGIRSAKTRTIRTA